MYVYRVDRKMFLIDYAVLKYAGAAAFRCYFMEMVEKHGLRGITLI